MLELPWERDMRVGIGHDTHRLEPGLPLLVGGVEIDSDRGAVGHSDADALLHAVTDALLGGGGLGDIGRWFPDTDPQWAGAASGQFVTAARDELARLGWQVVNLDGIVFVEAPRIAPYEPQIRASLAELLGVDAGRINVKAKTGEGVGPVGRGEVIAAQAVVLLARNEQAEPA